MTTQEIDLDHHVRLTLICEHPVLEDSEQKLEDICAVDQPVEFVTIPEVTYLQNAAMYAPDDIKDDFHPSTISGLHTKLERARQVRVTLSMKKSILNAVCDPRDVYEINNDVEEPDPNPDQPDQGVETDLEDDAVAYDPFADDEVEPEQTEEEKLIVSTALEVQKAWRERAERTARANQYATAQRKGLTEEDLMRHRLEAMREKEDARWLAKIDLKMASMRALSFTNQERVFLKRAVEVYCPHEQRMKLAEELLCTTPDQVAEEGASISEHIDVRRLLGVDTTNGRMGYMAGRIAAHMASHSETGRHVVEAVEHVVGGMTLRKALLLQ